jgi:hypothetical protein
MKPAMFLGRFCPTVKNLVTMVTMVALVDMVYKESKPTAEQGSLHKFEPQYFLKLWKLWD